MLSPRTRIEATRSRKDGDTVIILLGGGTKKRQQSDIETARGLWREYSRRKRQETG